MIFWITGKASSGKTTYAYKLKKNLELYYGKKVLLYDGDEVRSYFREGFTDEDRLTHIMRIASFASMAEKQGFIVIIALISPKKKWRMKARKLFKESILIHMPGGALWDGTKYEEPDDGENLCVDFKEDKK